MPHDREKPGFLDICGNIEVSRQGAQCRFVGLEEKSIFAAEMLKYRTFGNAKVTGHIADARGFIAVLGKVMHGSVQYQCPLMDRSVTRSVLRFAAVLAGDDPFPEAVIRSTSFAGISLLAGSRHAVGFNVPNPHLAPYEAQVGLREFLGLVRANYDAILIDCPPNLHACSWSAMAAADMIAIASTISNSPISRGVASLCRQQTEHRVKRGPSLGVSQRLLAQHQLRFRTPQHVDPQVLRSWA